MHKHLYQAFCVLCSFFLVLCIDPNRTPDGKIDDGSITYESALHELFFKLKNEVAHIISTGQVLRMRVNQVRMDSLAETSKGGSADQVSAFVRRQESCKRTMLFNPHTSSWRQLGDLPNRVRQVVHVGGSLDRRGGISFLVKFPPFFGQVLKL